MLVCCVLVVCVCVFVSPGSLKGQLLRVVYFHSVLVTVEPAW